MRFQFTKIEKLITETLRILFLITIVGSPLGGSRHQTRAMTYTTIITTTTLPIPSSSSLGNAGTRDVSTSKDNVPYTLLTNLLTATPSTTTTTTKTITTSSSTPQPPAASSANGSGSIGSGAVSTAPHTSSSASDALNDSNGIDIDDDARAERDNRNDGDGNVDGVGHNDSDDERADEEDSMGDDNIMEKSKTSRLPSFSLLSFNDTTASSLTLSNSGNSNNNNNNNNNNNDASSNNSSNISRNSKNVATTAATFLQNKSQKIALKTTTAAVESVTGGGHQQQKQQQQHQHQHQHQHNTNNNNRQQQQHNSKSSRDKVESKLVLPKPQKTDAPMLNYIFDTFSTANKHHHHDQRYGPHFEDVQRVGQPTNMTVQAGSSVYLNCRISLLQDKTVSWVRRNAQGESALDLLTVGLHTYTGEKRYTMEFQYPNNWRLRITNVKKDDEAMYECQISTHPPRVIQINLHVNAPKVMIVDEFGDPLQEKYYETDSTLQLSCIVRNVAMTSSVVFWKHGDEVLNYDITRGGVSVKTELMEDGANSTLFIAKINKSDSGNYSCSIGDAQEFSIVVHILNGESFAELHHGGGAHVTLHHATFAINLAVVLFLHCLSPALSIISSSLLFLSSLSEASPTIWSSSLPSSAYVHR